MNQSVTPPPAAGWRVYWPDALAFALGLGVAWGSGWNTTDLVWSLWLSILVVGYSMIVWMIFGPGVTIACGAWRDRAMLGRSQAGQAVGAAVVMLAGGNGFTGMMTPYKTSCGCTC